MIDPYHELANAIVLEAVKEYREAKEILRNRNTNKEAKLAVEDCEEFFRSGWFAILTSVDGEGLLMKLQEEEK